MKKILVICLCFLIIGCGNKEEEKAIIKYDNNYYDIATPYKNPTNNYTLRSYDKEEVENMLMKLSSKYFKTNNSLFEEGQYLTNEEVKYLLSGEQLNKSDEITVDNVTIKPNFITTIYEQNYLATNNNLKGMSLALVVNQKQSYIDNNKTLYKMVDEETTLKFAKEKAKELLEYIKSKEELKNTNIVIGIYLESNNNLKGGFKYIGQSSNNLKLEYVNYNYQLMDSSIIMQEDVNNYNNILALKNSIKSYTNLYLSATGLYQNKTLENLQINITSNYIKQSEILNISKLLSENLNNFDNNISIKVYFKSNNKVKAFLNKKANSNEIETYIMEG